MRQNGVGRADLIILELLLLVKIDRKPQQHHRVLIGFFQDAHRDRVIPIFTEDDEGRFVLDHLVAYFEEVHADVFCNIRRFLYYAKPYSHVGNPGSTALAPNRTHGFLHGLSHACVTLSRVCSQVMELMGEGSWLSCARSSMTIDKAATDHRIAVVNTDRGRTDDLFPFEESLCL